MSEKLFEVRTGELLASGLFKSVFVGDAPLWVSGQNVLFRGLSVRKLPGFVEIEDLEEGVPRGAGALQSEAGVQQLFVGTQEKLWRWFPGNLTDISKAGGYSGAVNQVGSTPATTWIFERWGNWMLATNGVDAVQIWKATGDFADLAGTTFGWAEIIVRVNAHMVALNTENGQSTFEWCHQDDVEQWVPTAENTAGNLNIRDMDGGIRAAVRLGDGLAVLSKNELIFVSYIGVPFIFNWRRVLRGIGAVGKRAVVEVNRRLFGLGDEGFWTTDGTQFEYIDTLALRAFLEENLNREQISKCFAHYDGSNDTIWWGFPGESGEIEHTVGFTLGSRAWTVATEAMTTAVPDQAVFRHPVTVDAAGKIYFHNTSPNAAGAALVATLRTKPMDLGAPEAWKFVDTLLVQLKRLEGVMEVRLGWSEEVDADPTWADWQALDLEMMRLHPASQAGRFVHLELRSTAVGADWQLHGFQLFGQLAGRDF